MAHSLPDLPYPHNALAPHISQETMEFHHDKHHAAYVNNLNAALEGHADLAGKSVDELIADLNAVPEAIRTAVRNNGGGHSNHAKFWTWMAPNAGGEPAGDLGQAITKAFGSFASFKEQFNKAGVGRFGSGWAWLVPDGSGGLKITSTPNQDSPLMEGVTPLLGVDVWEHAYYIDYRNARPKYLEAWWNVVNWDAVAKGFAAGKK